MAKSSKPRKMPRKNLHRPEPGSYELRMLAVPADHTLLSYHSPLICSHIGDICVFVHVNSDFVHLLSQDTAYATLKCLYSRPNMKLVVSNAKVRCLLRLSHSSLSESFSVLSSLRSTPSKSDGTDASCLLFELLPCAAENSA